MAKAKSLLEKIWWVIPPVVVVFGIPLFHIFYGTVTSGYPYSPLDWSAYVYIYSYIIGYIIFSTPGKLILILLSICMCFGYYISRRKSLLVRIFTPIIASIAGYFISLTVIMMEGL
jgi:hypothetical protein